MSLSPFLSPLLPPFSHAAELISRRNQLFGGDSRVMGTILCAAQGSNWKPFFFFPSLLPPPSSSHLARLCQRNRSSNVWSQPRLHWSNSPLLCLVPPNRGFPFFFFPPPSLLSVREGLRSWNTTIKEMEETALAPFFFLPLFFLPFLSSLPLSAVEPQSKKRDNGRASPPEAVFSQHSTPLHFFLSSPLPFSCAWLILFFLFPPTATGYTRYSWILRWCPKLTGRDSPPFPLPLPFFPSFSCHPGGTH